MLPQKMEGGYKALDIMEKQLNHHDYLVADKYTVADICLYAYTHVADEGGFDLTRYPAIGNWMNRVRNQANHKLITSK